MRSPEGWELFFRTSSALMRVPGRELEVTLRDGSPGTLVEASGYRLTPERDYDLHPDGQRVLMIRAEASIGGSFRDRATARSCRELGRGAQAPRNRTVVRAERGGLRPAGMLLESARR